MPNSTGTSAQGNDPSTLRRSSSAGFLSSQRAAESVMDHDDAPSLDDLDFVEPAGKPKTADPERRHRLIQDEMTTWRQIFQEGVTHQIGLARNANYRYPCMKLVERDGATRRELVYLAPEPWWYEKDGEIHLRLNFGERTWRMSGKNPVIRIGTMHDLLPTLEQIHVLVDTGDFDEIIEKMVIVSQR